MGKWLAALRPVEGASVNLVCFPHAGAGAGLFADWLLHMPAEWSVFAVRAPGRESRLREPVCEDMRDYVQSVVTELVDLDRPLALFGRCSGAVIAYETAVELEKADARVVGLFAAAQEAPHRLTPPPCLSDLALHDLIAHLTPLGGFAEDITSNAAMMQLLEPAIRGDLRLLERYHWEHRPAIGIPVCTYASEHDDTVSFDTVAVWRELTHAAFTLHWNRWEHFGTGLAAQLMPVVCSDVERLQRTSS